METMRETPEQMLGREKRDLELMRLRNRVRAQREEIKRLQIRIWELEGKKVPRLES